MSRLVSNSAVCDLCGSNHRLPLTDKARDGLVRNVVCRRCGLVYVHPRPKETSITNVYTSGEFGEEARGPGPPSTTKIQQSESNAILRLNRLERLGLAKAEPKRALDIGCGLGSSLWLLKAKGFQVKGLEPDPEYSKVGSEMYDVEILQDRYEDRTFSPGEFGVIMASHVLEHVASPSEFLGKLARDMASDGLAYIELPSITRPYGGDLQAFFWSAHLTSFSPATLEALLVRYGLQIVNDGWSDRFYWVVVRHGQREEPNLPVENAYRVWARLRLAHLRFEIAGKFPESFQERARYVDGIARWAKENPKEFTEVALRKLRSGMTGGRDRRMSAVHIGHHHPGNAGDTVLFQATRDLWDRFVSRTEWSKYEIAGKVSQQQLSDIDKANAVIVGGGGLFLKDTNPNKKSGWQWAVPTASLEALSTPLIVWAVGYNRFRNQLDFSDEFTVSLNALVDKSAFFGLRNRGSVEAVRKYLRGDLRDQVLYQPCPTVHLNRIYNSSQTISSFEQGDMTVALNAAFDRRLLRFGSPAEEDRILRETTLALKELTRQGWKLTVAVHLPTDQAITMWLESASVEYALVDLYRRPTEGVVEFYRQQALTIGMRGHSQMIPFGMNNAIISLISHDKLGWFLDDIGHPDWGLEVRAPNLDERLIQLAGEITGHSNTTLNDLREAELNLWEITQQNTERAKEILGIQQWH